MKDFPVAYLTANKLADYYAVGAHKQITVSIRASSGLYVCHTCRVNKCEHTEAVRTHVEQVGIPVDDSLPRDNALDLSGVEL